MFKGPPAPPGPVDSLVLNGDKLEAERGPVGKTGKTAGDMDGAKELFRRADYAQAEKVFHRIANDTKNSTQIAEEARYYEAARRKKAKNGSWCRPRMSTSRKANRSWTKKAGRSRRWKRSSWIFVVRSRTRRSSTSAA
jgi:hypothetical protein